MYDHSVERLGLEWQLSMDDSRQNIKSITFYRSFYLRRNSGEKEISPFFFPNRDFCRIIRWYTHHTRLHWIQFSFSFFFFASPIWTKNIIWEAEQLWFDMRERNKKEKISNRKGESNPQYSSDDNVIATTKLLWCVMNGSNAHSYEHFPSSFFFFSWIAHNYGCVVLPWVSYSTSPYTQYKSEISSSSSLYIFFFLHFFLFGYDIKTYHVRLFNPN